MKKTIYLLCPLLMLLFSCTDPSKIKDPADKPLEPLESSTRMQGKYEALSALDKRVKVEEIPAVNIISMGFTGGYQKHPEAYGKLMAYANKNYRTSGPIIGMYPQDPDLVSEDQLTWEISLRVLGNAVAGGTQPAPGNPDDQFAITDTKDAAPLESLKKPERPFQLKQLPAVTTVTLVSDVKNIGKDGLLLNAWITMNNYVQSATARSMFGAAKDQSQPIPVKITIPVKKRTKETL